MGSLLSSIRLYRKVNQLTRLKWWDIVVVTLIMFGCFIIISFMSLLSPVQSGEATSQALEFTTSSNWTMLVYQCGFLSLAMGYLYFRGFNFSQWPIRFSWKAVLGGVVLFAGVALLFDLYFIAIGQIFPNAYADVGEVAEGMAQETSPFLQQLSRIDLSLILYSLLNGFYEEIFFLGICLSTDPSKRIQYFIYSLIIRYSFHIYQGNINAIGIGFIVGIVYYLVYTKMKNKNLLPFFIAHAITDIMGAGLLSYFMSN